MRNLKFRNPDPEPKPDVVELDGTYEGISVRIYCGKCFLRNGPSAAVDLEMKIIGQQWTDPKMLKAKPEDEVNEVFAEHRRYVGQCKICQTIYIAVGAQ